MKPNSDSHIPHNGGSSHGVNTQKSDDTGSGEMTDIEKMINDGLTSASTQDTPNTSVNIEKKINKSLESNKSIAKNSKFGG